jgi:hypothetical protein
MQKNIRKGQRYQGVLGNRVALGTLPVSSVAPILILAAAFGLSVLFLLPNPVEFPMDDAYIHMVYAENLAETGKIFFNTPSDQGVGATSLLWVVLLALGHKIGLSIAFTSKFLGVSAIAGLGLGVYALFLRVWPAGFAMLVSVLVVLSGNLMWFALSGMETVFFLALGIWAIWAYGNQRKLGAGLLLGFLAITRPEGVILALAVLIFEAIRHRKLTSGMVVMGLCLAVIALPWYAYLFARTGHFLPTSAIGKQQTTALGLDLIVNTNPALKPLLNFPGVIYPFIWGFYFIEFVLGGIGLPGPTLPLGQLVDNADYNVSVWSLVLMVSIIFPLLGLAYKGFRSQPIGIRLADASQRPLLLLLSWAVIHNLVFMLFLPVPGTASRYGAINHVLFWSILVYGLTQVSGRPSRWLFLAGGLFSIAAVNIVYWNQVYDANLDHMTQVRIPAALFVRDNFGADEPCAVFDIGAVRRFGGRPVIDIGGLIDPNLGYHQRAGTMNEHFWEQGARCMVLPGRTQTTEEGWFDIADGLGATVAQDFTLESVAEFQIPRKRWLTGYLPTNNYQASVVIYRLVER